jgi:hypothetical protein
LTELTPQPPPTAFSDRIRWNREKEKAKTMKMMDRMKIDLKKSGGDFSSANTFPPKQTAFLLDLSVLFIDLTRHKKMLTIRWQVLGYFFGCC